MKRFFIPLLLFFFAAGLFAQNLTPLEKQIISAGPEEMLNLVMDRNKESELNLLYNHIEEMTLEEIILAYSVPFPEITEEECMFIILKVALVAALGSGDKLGVSTGLDILEFCDEIDSMTDTAYLPEELKALTESSYWKDCIAFYHLFDPESFLKERFPGYF